MHKSKESLRKYKREYMRKYRKRIKRGIWKRRGGEEMKSRTLKAFFLMAFLTFFIGDLGTTYTVLEAGHYESNPILSTVGFVGTVLAKIMFFILAYFVITNIESKGYETYGSFALGCIFMTGFLTIIINSGVFYR